MVRSLKFLLITTAMALSSCSGPKEAVLELPGGPSSEDPPQKSDYTPAQQLIVAAFELDVAKVDSLLKSGVDPNGRLGFYDERLFEDKWSLGYSRMGSDRWTSLLAVASSHREPQPPVRAENSTAGRNAAEKQRQAVSPELIRESDDRRLAIAKLLVAAKADLDLDDGYGATALYEAVYNEFNDVALLLIEAGANVNTKTGIYIDGSGDVTPLHRASDNPVLLEALLKHGADVHAKDTKGDTPLDWARWQENNDRCIQLLLDAGAK